MGKFNRQKFKELWFNYDLRVFLKLPIWIVFFMQIFSCGTGTKVVNERSNPIAGEFGDLNTEDLRKKSPEEQEFLNRLSSDSGFVSCREKGKFYDRRSKTCLDEFSTGTFPCNRPGIQSKFADTGFQIVTVLDRALGRIEDQDDRGDGFFIDQCGESAAGKYMIMLVKPSDNGKITIRVIQ